MATAIATFLHSIDGGGVGQGIHSSMGSNSQHPLAYIHHALVFNSNNSNAPTASTIHPSNIVSGNLVHLCVSIHITNVFIHL